jgi:hypothetical protein
MGRSGWVGKGEELGFDRCLQKLANWYIQLAMLQLS